MSEIAGLILMGFIALGGLVALFVAIDDGVHGGGQ